MPKFNMLSFALVIVAASILVYYVNPTDSSLPVQRAQNAQSSDVKLAQSFSSRCSTSKGICYVDPAPIGSPCTCPNGAPGTIVR